jgi:hypothetical protein
MAARSNRFEAFEPRSIEFERCCDEDVVLFVAANLMNVALHMRKSELVASFT